MLIVTWNRRADVDRVLRAVSRQAFDLARADVVVIDNGSSDGTADALIEAWRPERVVSNPTPAAHEPAFAPADLPGPNAGGFGSLTIIRNAINHGGCGGFNTGLAYVERFLDIPERAAGAGGVGYAWLLDDDVDLPTDALRQLWTTAENDESIGIVGSRTVDLADRTTTIETTIYFDAEHGRMGDEPVEGHRLYEDHTAWAAEVGGTRGTHDYSGIREVDIVSACSMLARWSCVKRVGFWDHRYFIYCDDADWCLRFARAGFRVVCDLDAVVFHTPWHYKLTPARIYYSQRNIVWMLEKVLPRKRLKRAVGRWMGSILSDSRKASSHCRAFHAEIIRRTARDIASGRGGKLEQAGPPVEPLLGAFDRAGANRVGARVVVMCSRPGSIEWAEQLRGALLRALRGAGRLADQPRWTYMVGEHVPDVRRGGGGALGVGAMPERIVFRANRWSKLRAQAGMLARPPTAVVVFDQTNDFPLVRSRWNIHVDRKSPESAQVERDGALVRARFLARWTWTALLAFVYVARLKPHVSRSKYG